MVPSTTAAADVRTRIAEKALRPRRTGAVVETGVIGGRRKSGRAVPSYFRGSSGFTALAPTVAPAWTAGVNWSRPFMR